MRNRTRKLIWQVVEIEAMISNRRYGIQYNQTDKKKIFLRIKELVIWQSISDASILDEIECLKNELKDV